MNTSYWKPFKYQDLFHIYTFKGDNILNSQEGGIPYVSSSEENNGVSTFVESQTWIDANKITVARNGSICSAFYQSKDFCASPDDIRIFELKEHDLTPAIGIFLCTLIEKEKYRYAYGRKFGTKRMLNQTIKLPVTAKGKPDWNGIEDFVSQQLVPLLSKHAQKVWNGNGNFIPKAKATTLSLSDSHQWKYFYYKDVFDIVKGKRLTKDAMTEGRIPFIGATDANNGITARISNDENIHQGNVITVSYNGSIAEAFYQQKPFVASDDINILYPKGFELTPYIAIFLCTLIKREKYRYNYGRKWHSDKMKFSRIKLPVTTTGQPDWSYMENYIKGLPYSSYL